MENGFYFDSENINKKVNGFSKSGFYIGNYEESEIISRLMSCLAGGTIIALSIADADTEKSFVIAFDQHGVIGNFGGNEVGDGAIFNELKPIFESILDSFVPMRHSTKLMEYMSENYLGDFTYIVKWKEFDDF